MDEARGDPLDALSPWERFAVRFAGRCRRPPWVWLVRVWQIAFVETILFPFSRRMVVEGLERLAQVPRDAPLLVVCNHRTYFDLFAVFYVLRTRLRLRHPLSFPVRADFFYERPLGLLTGWFFSGCAMYPPIFRKGPARAFNARAIELLIGELKQPRRMVGFHPEGTRGKSDDPYELLPAKRGAGELVLAARPVVIPVFISGMKNSLGAEYLDSFRLRPRGRIRITFGAPVDLSRWPATGEKPTQAEALACSEALMAEIAKLADEQRTAAG